MSISNWFAPALVLLGIACVVALVSFYQPIGGSPPVAAQDAEPTATPTIPAPNYDCGMRPAPGTDSEDVEAWEQH